MQPCTKSSPFLVHLNLESSRPRFILEHKYAQSLYDLTEADKMELFNLALWLTRESCVKKAFLSISFGENAEHCGAYKNFYAQLVISNISDLSPKFKALVVDKWHVAHQFSSDSRLRVKSKSSSNSSEILDPETPPLNGLRFMYDNFEENVCERSETMQFTTSFWMEKRIVGICCSNFSILLEQPFERWRLLDFMTQRLASLMESQHGLHCSLIVSLKNFFTIHKKKKVFGLVKFRKPEPMGNCFTSKVSVERLVETFSKSKKKKVKKSQDPSDLNICEKEVEYDSKVWVMIDLIGYTQT